MKKPDLTEHTGAPASKPSRQARLQALLFAGAAFGTALLTLAAAEPKSPPFRGE